MADIAPVDVFVDVPELGRLRSELQTLLVELTDLPAHGTDVDAAAFGGADVAGAVDRFTVHWTAGRARITDNLGQCLALAEGAIEAYTATESRIENAMSAPAGGGTR